MRFVTKSWHCLLIVAHTIATTSLLVSGLALCLLSQRRGWQPTLPAALAVGAALRVAVASLAATQSWQPYDFANDFTAAAAAVLHHHDPVLAVRPRGWPFPPTMAFVLAGELKLGQLTHLAWPIVGRLAPVIADLVLIVLVGRLATHRGPLRRFQYACNPLPIMVCAIHGQLEPEVLALGVAAFIAARSPRGGAGWAAGALLGASIAVGVWSVLLLPGVLLSLPDARRRLTAACCAFGIPAAFVLSSPLTVGTPVRQSPAVVHGIIGLRPVVGTWGWTTLVTHGNTELMPSTGTPGVLLLCIGLLTAGYLWRRAHPVDLTIALLIAFLIFSPRVSAQYLVWPVPFLTARMTRWAMPAMTAAAVWAGVSYVGFGPGIVPGWLSAHAWAIASLAVIPLLILALPWQRRRRPDVDVARPTARPATPSAIVGPPVSTAVGPGQARGGVRPGQARGGVRPGLARRGVRPGLARDGVGPSRPVRMRARMSLYRSAGPAAAGDACSSSRATRGYWPVAAACCR